MTQRSIIFPRQLNSDLAGYNFLSNLCVHKTLPNKMLIFDLSNTIWIEANLCSPLAAIIFQLNSVAKHVEFRNIRSNIQDIFNRNQFSAQFMNMISNEDFRTTTIACSRFNFDDNTYFQRFVDTELLSKPNFPTISVALKKKINKSILEIFNNAHIHGLCDCIYTCGQYYPSKKTLHFTISDMGQTIRKNVNDFLDSKINGAKAIEWAVQEGNTTRTGNIPGGLGISLIRDFLKLNEGGIEIVSSDGYWHEEKGKSFSETLPSRFLGTIVNLKFNLADQKSYILASEIDPTQIW